ncbi:MAG: Stp1/IreP family PP2C-type Ser/Thr phosphatase, partial [Oscillospiraceae bacterium]|nr:Stp1/IreP family PP2C-type Ser/Thr phosphatase [Oscillospiraceae bacterium]
MQCWTVTDPGRVRTQNQDACKTERLNRTALLCVVCDGMGGAKSGNIASTLAADVFTQAVTASYKSSMDQTKIDELLRSAIKLANFTVYDQAQTFADFDGMGTTLVAILVHGKQATVVNVGDSRVYHIGTEGIRQVTRDHSLVQMMIDRGELTPQQGKSYPGKNMITRAVGTEAVVQCDLFHLELDRGDSLLACTDGLSNLVDEQEILFEVVYYEDKKQCCQHLLQIALDRGA